jgi:hypothetical protein
LFFYRYTTCIICDHELQNHLEIDVSVYKAGLRRPNPNSTSSSQISSTSGSTYSRNSQVNSTGTSRSYHSSSNNNSNTFVSSTNNSFMDNNNSRGGSGASAGQNRFPNNNNNNNSSN